MKGFKSIIDAMDHQKTCPSFWGIIQPQPSGGHAHLLVSVDGILVLDFNIEDVKSDRREWLGDVLFAQMKAAIRSAKIQRSREIPEPIHKALHLPPGGVYRPEE